MPTSTLQTPYTTGTASIANGSASVTGSGTLWNSAVNAQAGDLFLLDGLIGVIQSVDSNTGLTLTKAWPGTSRTGVAYQILRTSPLRYDPAVTQDVMRQLLASINAGIIPSAATRPDTVTTAGAWWLKIVSSTQWEMYVYDGGSGDGTLLGTIDPTTHAFAIRSPWTSYTPTAAPTSGAWTSHTVEGRYMRIGEMIVAHVRITVTNNGTGAGYVTASLPVARADQLGIVVGREVAVSGLGLFGSLVSASSIGFLTYANAYPLGASGVIDVMAVYKAGA